LEVLEEDSVDPAMPTTYATKDISIKRSEKRREGERESGRAPHSPPRMRVPIMPTL